VKKYTKLPQNVIPKWPLNLPIGNWQLYQIAIKYVYQHLPKQDPPKFTQNGILV
jgi:hypothetical protein